MSTQLEAALSAANPVTVDDSVAHGPRADAALARILTTPADAGSPRRAPRRRLFPVAVLAVVAAIAGAVIVFGPEPTPSYPATPVTLRFEHAPTTRDADHELRALANKVEARPNDVGSGSDALVEMRSWSLFTRVDGEQVTSEVVPVRTSTRTRPDGSATITRTTNYDGVNVEEFTTRDPLDYPLRGLSSDPSTLARQLGVGQPAENGTAGLFDSIVVANRQMPLEPDVRAAVLRLLARTGDVSSVGRLDDRLGRPGVGFSVDSAYSGLPTRYLLIFDPTDGRLLGYEELLTTDPGKLNVRVPSVINYQVFENAKYID